MCLRHQITLHLYTEHIKTKGLRCRYCGYSTAFRTSNIRQHVRTKHPGRPANDYVDKRWKYLVGDTLLEAKNGMLSGTAEFLVQEMLSISDTQSFEGAWIVLCLSIICNGGNGIGMEISAKKESLSFLAFYAGDQERRTGSDDGR